MSSFYGIFYRDGRKVTEDEARKMQQVFDWWKPDESGYVIQNNILIGQATLWNTPESKHEHLPLSKAPYILAMDARIDNREALAKELDLPDRPMAQIGDSEFILAAYRKWGAACADRLLGDFAFVIWDEAKQELFCARDFIGVRPFYYYLDEEKFIFGSDLKALSQHPDIPLEIYDESVANFIINLGTGKKHTFFKSIYKLEDGCHISIQSNTYTITRYWHPESVKKKQLPNKKAYIDELRNILEESVKARLRSCYPVASHLSGGLDSSPLAILASRELKKKNPHQQLPVFTWIPKPSAPEEKKHYEWNYIHTIAKQEQMRLYWNTLSSDEIFQALKTKNITTDGCTFSAFEIPILKKSSELNIRSILSGWGGDEFLTNHAYAYLSELFLKGKWIYIYNTLKNKNFKKIIKSIYYHIIIPNMPTRLYCYFPKITCRHFNFNTYQHAFIPYLKKVYRTKTHIFARHTANTVKKDIIRAWKNGHVQNRLEGWNQEALPYHLQYVYPLLDKRLVAFSLYVPTEYLFKDSYDRYLYRKAIEDIMPSKVLWGVHKAEPKREKKNKIVFDGFRNLLEKEGYIKKHIKPLHYFRQVPEVRSEEFMICLLVEKIP